MKRILYLAAAAALSCLASCSNDEVYMLLGTYTDGGTSKGAYSYVFNQRNGKSREISSVETPDPSFIVPSVDGTHAYSVKQSPGGRHGATSYVLGNDRSLSLLNTRPGIPGPGANVEICGYDLEDSPLAGRPDEKAGTSPCNILVDKGHIITSNYSGGDIGVYPIKEDGSIGDICQFIRINHTPHIHCAIFSPDSAYVFFTDLGNDMIFRFTVDRTSDANHLKDCTVAYSGEKGWGPRHIIFNKAGDKAYLIDELGDMLVVLKYNQDHTFTPIQSVLAYDGEGGGGADIHLSPDEKFLYTSHRLKKDGVAIFKVKEDGTVEKAGYQLTGIHPRNFNISPDGKWVLVACRDSDVIQVFRRDKDTGLLESWKNGQRDISLSKPVCVSWVK